MSKALINVKRSELQLLATAFEKSATVVCAPREDVQTVNRFKYACGRNYEAAQKAIDETDKLRERLNKEWIEAHPRWSAYRKKQEDICKAHATRDEQGNPVLDTTDPHLPQYTFTMDAKKLFDDETAACRAEYQDVIALRNAFAGEMEAVLEQEVTLPIHRFSFAELPRRITGTFISAISIMLTDIPGEEASPAAGADEPKAADAKPPLSVIS